MTLWNEAEEVLAVHLAELHLDFHRQVLVIPTRKWLLDFTFAWKKQIYAIEVNGGKWTGGHRRGNRVDSECDKLNEATMQGYRVLAFTREQVNSGEAKRFIKERVLEVKKSSLDSKTSVDL